VVVLRGDHLLKIKLYDAIKRIRRYNKKTYKTLFKTPQRAMKEVGAKNVLMIKEINTYIDDDGVDGISNKKGKQFKNRKESNKYFRSIYK